MSQRYKVRISFSVELSAVTDDMAESLARRSLRDLLEHVEATSSTHVMERSPSKTIEYSTETEYVGEI